jgi:hypothetical protein
MDNGYEEKIGCFMGAKLQCFLHRLTKKYRHKIIGLY